MTESSSIIYWTSSGQQGNKRLQKLHPDMLKPQGYKVLRERTLGGMKHLKSVHYDVHYVVAKIVADILDPLEMSVDDFASWLSENAPLIYARQTGSAYLNPEAIPSEELIPEVGIMQGGSQQ